MISSRRLIQLARRWMRAAAAGRKRIPFQKEGAANAMAPGSAVPGVAPVAVKGHFVVYSNDEQRFEVPLAYLRSDIFRELLKMSEDVFGLPGAGPIILPCDAAFMGSVISCLRRRSSRDAERALLASMVDRPCSASVAQCSWLPVNQQLLVCGC